MIYLNKLCALFALFEYQPSLDMVHPTRAVVSSTTVHGEEESPSCTHVHGELLFTDHVIWFMLKLLIKNEPLFYESYCTLNSNSIAFYSQIGRTGIIIPFNG